MTEKYDSRLAIDELSSYLKISKSIRYQLARKGTIPGQKIGKHWRFRKNCIDQWLAATDQTKNKKQHA
ncbi:MAG: helix-turn-helix domain-containing protein [Deltaproteobacteria bacterium]|nr:helix-turn-helix domain-containing protein [Candidatus Anaeroferrophillus wilburensis]MBN2889967.1 helix-turn-helix domain-containing protein [Deltaproteobacteria bacterium]